MMKKLHVICCFILTSIASTTYAQNCGFLTVYNQTDVDNFVAANAGSCNVLQALDIRADVDLSGLSFIQWISESFKLESGVHLSSFQGLQNVQNIGRLEIKGSVDSFENLDALRSIGALVIHANPSNIPTISLVGLESVTSLGELSLLYIDVVSFNSLQNVTSTSMNGFFIASCSGIQEISIFNFVKEITGRLAIGGNPDLHTISGLSNLETVVKKTNSAVLSTTSISGNPILTSISGLSQLSNIDSFQLANNSLLNDCCVLLPFLYASDPSEYVIYNNASDCYNQNFIFNYCQPITDTDDDGVFDAVDNCILSINANQSDIDNDGQGDVCDADIDGDGFLNSEDNCPDIPNNNQADSDNDGIGDVCATQSGTGTGSFGVGTTMPVSKFQVTEGDVYIDNLYRGIIMRSPSGKCFRYKPDNKGMLVGKEIPCPN